MPDEVNHIIEGIGAAAKRWRDPGYPVRAEAVERTLEADNRFTEQAVAFAVNQQMHLLQPDALRNWIDGRRAQTSRTVGVLNAGNVPLTGLQDFLAVVLTGHRYCGKVSSKSPALLPAFVEEVKQEVPDCPARFVESAEEVFDAAETIIATGTDETRAWAEEQCEAHQIPSERRLLRGHRYSVAVIDGNESEEEREGLAEDALLHEGYGCRNIALIWAPRDLNPDPYLEAFALFRGLFPTHPDMPGSLEMQQAVLEATDQSHAYGEGLEFLMSRGDPEPQRPGHIRWTEYDDLEAVRTWLRAHEQDIQLVVARSGIAGRLPDALTVEPPGDAQRPDLGWQPNGIDTVAFLAGL